MNRLDDLWLSARCSRSTWRLTFAANPNPAAPPTHARARVHASGRGPGPFPLDRNAGRRATPAAPWRRRNAGWIKVLSLSPSDSDMNAAIGCIPLVFGCIYIDTIHITGVPINWDDGFSVSIRQLLRAINNLSINIFV